MIGASRSRVRPKHDNILELTVFCAVDRHRPISPVLTKPEARLVANSFPD